MKNNPPLPNNLTEAEYHELAVGSAIHPALIEGNFFHVEGDEVYDYLFISDKIPRKNAGRVTDGYLKLYSHLLLGATRIQSLDPHNNWLPMEWGRMKPNTPRIDWEKGKPVKYESPPKTANRVTYFDVADCVWDLVAVRYGLSKALKDYRAGRAGEQGSRGAGEQGSRGETCNKFSPLPLDTSASFPSAPLPLCPSASLPPKLFWEWVKQHPQIPIILCEGEKKAACLLSLGFVAIALPGIWNGRIGKQDLDERLHPDLVPMAQPGRKFIILFDYETKPKTRWSVFQATSRTVKAIVAAGASCEVALLPGTEKGVDDFVVARGEDANALLTAIIDDAKNLKDYQRWYFGRKWGLTKYSPDVCVNVKYLLDAFVDQAPLGRGVGCGVWGVGEEIAPTTSGTQAPSFQDDGIGEGSKPRPMPSSLHPTPYPLHPVFDKGTLEKEATARDETPALNERVCIELPTTENDTVTKSCDEKEILSQISRYLTMPVSGLLVLWSDMGTGKTELMRWWRKQNPDARFLNNGHRVNLLKNLALRLETAMYSDLGYTGLAQAKALSITIDSLHKLNTQALTYGCVFIDEACQYLTHLLHSNTCKEHRAAILEVLEYIVYNAKMVVIADAHMDDVTVDFFRSMRPPGEQPYIIKNEWKNGNRLIHWYEGDNSSALVAQISAALLAEQKIMVVSDSKRFIKKLEKSLTVKIEEETEGVGSEQTPQKLKKTNSSIPPTPPHPHTPTPSKLRIWSVHSDNSGSEENIAFIKDITNAVKNLDALLTSPSLGTGVDINQYHFDLVFGVFHAVSQTATECAQQLYRYRPVVPIHIWVAPRPPFGYKDTNATKIKERILQTNEMTAFLIRIDRKTGKRGAEKDWALEAYCQILANRNQSINNLREDLRSLLLQMGNRIVVMGSDDDEGAIANLKNAAQALDSAYHSSVAKANNITATEYRARQSKDYLTPEEVFECEKYRIFSSYGMEVTPELVELDRGGRLVGAIASLEAILSEPGSPIIDEAGRSLPTPPAFVTESDRGEREKLSLCIDWSNYSARWLARFNLGLHHILKHLVNGGEVTATDPDLLNMTAIAIQCAAHIKAILGFTVPSDCEPIWLLATLVEQLGLKLSCRKQGPRGEQVKFYSLSVEELSFASAVIAHRQNKREHKAQTQPQQELKINTSPVSTPPP